jgi:hypothetical protein
VNLPPGSAPVVALSGVDRTLLRLLPAGERLTPDLIGAAPVLLALPHGVDPDLREPGDLTDEELLAGVRAAWEVVLG